MHVCVQTCKIKWEKKLFDLLFSYYSRRGRVIKRIKTFGVFGFCVITVCCIEVKTNSSTDRET